MYMGVSVTKRCIVISLFAIVFLMVVTSFAADKANVDLNSAKPSRNKTTEVKKPASNTPIYVIERAVMCEDIQDMEPVREAIVFSVENGHIICFTAIKNIKTRTYIIHKWIHKDEVTTTMKLKVRPPYWRTYSKIQLRETDKGPWRVEILDPNGNVLKVLRFSVTD